MKLRSVLTVLGGGLAGAADPWNCSSFAPSVFTPISLTNNVPGMKINVIPYGATLVNVYVPDAKGIIRDVILGFDDTVNYCNGASHPYFGAAIGRIANRIGNGTFVLDGVTYTTPINERYSHPYPGGNPAGDTLHGGTVGWDRREWTVMKYNGSSVTFGLLSPDGEEGFPGDLTVLLTYTLTDKTTDAHPAWDVQYSAFTTSPVTVIATSQVRGTLHRWLMWTAQVDRRITQTYLLISAFEDTPVSC